ncbi:MAG TPA: DUF6335 family protein [Vicinamibacterales bacterium]|jgi:Family of unknown function (DUF6335)|nr:DUF6335 family protein [Vicinamibacterales bacterium]
MAKRKAARTAKRARKSKKVVKKAQARAAARKTARASKAQKARNPARARAKKKAARKSAPRKAVRASTRKAARPSVRKTARRAATAVVRKAPALDRERRTMQGDDIVPTPPSSLDLDRNASAIRTGRKQMHDRLAEHHETSPALTAGDVDADWESAATVGDEAPGGDNPTPDQDIVDDIGRAVGVQYEDNEELKGEEKIIKRDKHRWELDPASSEDYDER